MFRSIGAFLRDSYKVLLFVGFIWLLATVLYYHSLFDPIEVNKHADELIAQLDKVYSKKADRQTQLKSMLFAELIRHDKASLFKRIEEHLSIAFAVSGILILAVDIHLRRQTRKEIRQYRDEVGTDVWKAVSKRLLPDAIGVEIDEILKQGVVKADSRFTITFKAPYPGMDNQSIVLKRAVYYRLHNLTHMERFRYPIRIELVPTVGELEVTDNNGSPVRLPGHRKFSVNNQLIELQTALDPNNPKILEHVVYLPRESKTYIEIYSETEEALRLSDVYSMTTLTLMTDFQVAVMNEIPGTIRLRRIILRHPKYREFVPGADGVWRFYGGLLPGQGFSVLWERI